MTVVGPIRSMGCSPKPSLLMAWLAKRQIAQRRSKSFLEMRRAFRTKTRMVVGMMKRRQAVIDPRSTLRVEGIWAQRGLVDRPIGECWEIGVSFVARVIRFHTTGGPEVLQIDEVDVGAPGRVELRRRVHPFGLNRAEAMFRSGKYLEQPKLPGRLGYEAAGTVEAIGECVTGFAIGEKVSTIP